MQTGAPAVVTGAGRGIGRAVAERLARDGHPVALQSRGLEELEATRAAIEAAGGRAICVPGDVTSAEAAEALFARCAEAFGPARLAVGGAGQAISAPLSRTSAEDVQRLVSVNCVSALHLIKAASATMAPLGGGRVVIIASTAGVSGMAYTGAYSASKHAVIGLVKCAALELAPKHITVNAVCPGWVRTPMFDATLANIAAKTGASVEDAERRLEARIPVGRVLEADEVAALVAYVCSEAAAKLTGQALVIDGGETL